MLVQRAFLPNLSFVKVATSFSHPRPLVSPAQQPQQSVQNTGAPVPWHTLRRTRPHAPASSFPRTQCRSEPLQEAAPRREHEAPIGELLHAPAGSLPCALTIDLGLHVPQYTSRRAPCSSKTCHCCLLQTSYTGQLWRGNHPTETD